MSNASHAYNILFLRQIYKDFLYLNIYIFFFFYVGSTLIICLPWSTLLREITRLTLKRETTWLTLKSKTTWLTLIWETTYVLTLVNNVCCLMSPYYGVVAKECSMFNHDNIFQMIRSNFPKIRQIYIGFFLELKFGHDLLKSLLVIRT